MAVALMHNYLFEVKYFTPLMQATYVMQQTENTLLTYAKQRIS